MSMDNIEKITGRILTDANVEADKIRADAEVRCREIGEKGEADAKSVYWAAIRKGTDDAKIRMERLMSAAELEAKKQVLRAKQEIIGEAFDRAAERMRQLPPDSYAELLAAMAASSADTGEEEIILSAGDRERYGASIADKANDGRRAQGKKAGLRLSGETRETGGGLILKNGNIETNCTFGAAVGELKNELTAGVAAVLFS